ncbi:MAG: chemotaxis protein CheW, partial [Isosphaeraceae bacterium]
MKSLEGTTQLCTFQLGELLLGLDVKRVQEVLRHQPMTHVPLASRVIRGL